MDLHLRLMDRTGYRVLLVTGELDLSTAGQLQNRLADVIQGSATPLVVDLEGVRFCDSSGLSAAVAAERLAAKHGVWLAFANARPAVAKLFQITNLDQCLRIYPNLRAALAGLPHTTSA